MYMFWLYLPHLMIIFILCNIILLSIPCMYMFCVLYKITPEMWPPLYIKAKRLIPNGGHYRGVPLYIDILTIIINFPYSTCISSFFGSSIPTSLFIFKMFFRTLRIRIIESVEMSELTQYITNGGISGARYIITHFEHHHRVLRLISNRMSI